jgi:RNA polymerase sigma-70 factor (ECF subfamily)
MNQTDEKELYLKLKNGDESAFRSIFRNYYPSLCHFAFQFLNDRELAEETVQDLFVKFWEKKETLNIENSVKHYLFRAVKNQCINQLQHEKIKQKYAGKVKENFRESIDPEFCFPEVDLVGRIEKSIESLPPKRKEIFRLSRENGLKYKEIADELHISVKTVEAQMGLALKHLREELKDFSDYLINLLFIFRKK